MHSWRLWPGVLILGGLGELRMLRLEKLVEFDETTVNS